MNKVPLLLILFSASLFGDGGSGSSGGGGSTPTPSTATVHANSVVTLPGGTCQLQYFLSQPRPITYADIDVSSDEYSLDGIAASGPTANVWGVALAVNGMVHISLVSPDSSLGTDGYPLLTLTMDAPQAPIGTQSTISLQGVHLSSLGGTLILSDPKPPSITIGGSLSVSGVYPGGGTWPAGTVLSLRGTGFQPGTKVNAHLQAGQPVYISPNEFHITLTHDQTIDRTLFEVSNPDGSQQRFYAYPRGILVAQPSLLLLQKVEPIFSTALSSTSGITIPSLTANQFAAIALQNPGIGPLSVTLNIPATGETVGVYLPSQGRLVESLSVIFGRQLLAEEKIVVNATSPVQIVGMIGDQSAATVTPLGLAF